MFYKLFCWNKGQEEYIGLEGFPDSKKGDIDSSDAAKQDYEKY